MKRVILMLAALTILCVAAGRAQAHDFHYAYRPSPRLLRPAGPWADCGGPAGGAWCPVRVAPRVVYPPVYGYYPYPYCAQPVLLRPGPYYGFYYQSGGVSIGVGF